MPRPIAQQNAPQTKNDAAAQSTIAISDGLKTKLFRAADLSAQELNEIRTHTGRYDPASVTSLAQLVLILCDDNYQKVRKDDIDAIADGMNAQEIITPEHLTFLIDSCDVLLRFKDAT